MKQKWTLWREKSPTFFQFPSSFQNFFFFPQSFNLLIFIFSFFKKFLFLLYFTLQYCIGFPIHWHESTMCVHAIPRIQLSHPYMTTGKTIALTRQTFVDKVMSLLFNVLSMLVITFLPRSKCLLISWLQSSSVVILKPPK